MDSEQGLLFIEIISGYLAFAITFIVPISILGFWLITVKIVSGMSLVTESCASSSLLLKLLGCLQNWCPKLMSSCLAFCLLVFLRVKGRMSSSWTWILDHTVCNLSMTLAIIPSSSVLLSLSFIFAYGLPSSLISNISSMVLLPLRVLVVCMSCEGCQNEWYLELAKGELGANSFHALYCMYTCMYCWRSSSCWSADFTDKSFQEPKLNFINKCILLLFCKRSLHVLTWDLLLSLL